MNPSSVLMLALAGQLLMPRGAQSQYTYVTHPSVLVRQGVNLSSARHLGFQRDQNVARNASGYDLLLELRFA